MKQSEIEQIGLIENPLVQSLLKEYLQMTESPVYKSWLAMWTQINKFCDEIINTPISIRSNTPKKKKSKNQQEDVDPQQEIDDEKDFTKAEKVMSKLPEWVKNERLLYDMLSPKEKSKADALKNPTQQVYI